MLLAWDMEGLRVTGMPTQQKQYRGRTIMRCNNTHAHGVNDEDNSFRAMMVNDIARNDITDPVLSEL
jgi:hypothetical protein